MCMVMIWEQAPVAENLFCDGCKKFDRELPPTFDTFHVDEHGWTLCNPCFVRAEERESAAMAAYLEGK